MITLDRSKKLHTQITEDTWCKCGMYIKNANQEIEGACLMGYLELYYGTGVWVNTSPKNPDDRVRAYLFDKFPDEWCKGGRSIAYMNDCVLKFSDLTEMLKELDI